MAVENTLTIKTSYTKTSDTREYSFGGLSDAYIADYSAIRGKIQAINESLAAGTAGGLSAFFISDDFDASDGTGYLESIVSAQIVSVEEEIIY